MEKKIWTYETYAWLVRELREGLEFVDAASGALRSQEEMSALIGVVSELMREIPSQRVREISERLERQKKYLEPLQEELEELKQQVGDDELVRLCLKEWRLEYEEFSHRTSP